MPIAAPKGGKNKLKEDILEVHPNCFLHSFKKIVRNEITMPSKKEAAAKKIWALAVSGFRFRSK
ncbi:MAG TPA: hypothetical protein DD384_00570, partial [Firmicutes bacterium]|nr:hypothetical protein [Bacillota bacterium]